VICTHVLGSKSKCLLRVEPGPSRTMLEMCDRSTDDDDDDNYDDDQYDREE